MKLHRTVAYLDGREYTLITLRPATTERFAVNLFHDAWHVLSGQAGATLFARLLWGLSYQRRENTLVVVDRRFLAPTPFEAEESVPIVLVPTDCTPFGGAASRELRRLLPRLKSPDGTVRWHTHGLDAALADADAWWREHRRPPWDEYAYHHHRRRVDHVLHDGLIVLPGSARELRQDAMSIAALAVSPATPMDYTYLPRYEFQIFHDFRRRVSAARTARREIEALATPPDRFVGRGYHEGDPVRRHIWERGTEIRIRRMRGRPVQARPPLYQTRSVNDIERSGATALDRTHAQRCQPNATA
jgi:hypothetical protein